MSSHIEFFGTGTHRWVPPEGARSVEIAMVTAGGGGGVRGNRIGQPAQPSGLQILFKNGSQDLISTDGAFGGGQFAADRDRIAVGDESKLDIVVLGGNGSPQGRGPGAGGASAARAIPARYNPEDFQRPGPADFGQGGRGAAMMHESIDDTPFLIETLGGGAAGLFLARELPLEDVSYIEFIIGAAGAAGSIAGLATSPISNTNYISRPPTSGQSGLLRLTIRYIPVEEAREDTEIEPVSKVTFFSPRPGTPQAGAIGDYCELIYGEAPCTAALSADNPHKCFNTYWTCQDRDNYRGSNLELSFGFPRSGNPKERNLFPLIRSISTAPTELNPDGRDNRYGPLGKRASVTIVFDDMPYNDIGLDKYQPERISGAAQFDGIGYDPETRGTFWTKWRARNEYYTGRIINVQEGFIGIASEFRSVARSYVIERFEGPDSSGRFRIVAKDILSLATQDKAIAPVPSTGETAEAITVDASTVQLIPGVAGQYDGAETYVRIGDEIIQATRNGDRLLLNTRGAFGSERSDHAVGEPVQLCLLYRNERIDQIIRDILINYANIPGEYLGDWEPEASQWLESHQLTNIISEPTGVDKIIGSLMNLGCYIWWDERTQKIRLRAVRPELTPENLPVLSDESTFLSFPSLKDFPNRRISQMYLYYAPRDYTSNLRSPSNYRRLQVFSNPLQERPVEYGEAKIVQVFAPWIDESNTGLALALAGSLAARNRFIPQEQSFEADPNRMSSVWTGDVVRIDSRSKVSPTGERERGLWQILSAEETRPKEQARYTAWPLQESLGTGGKLAFIMPDDTPNYADTTEEQRTGKACWVANGEGVVSDGEPGWIII